MPFFNAEKVSEDAAFPLAECELAANQGRVFALSILGSPPNLLRKELRDTHCFRVAAMIQFESAAKG